MNKRVKKLWVKALRSGKYKKGLAGLRPTPSTFCCLGVLSDLHRIEHKSRWTVDRLTGEYQYGTSPTGEPATGMLSTKVMDWAGAG